MTPKIDKEIMRNYGFTIDKVEMNDMIRLNDMMKEARQDERATIRSKVEGLMCKPDHDCDVNAALKKVLKIIDQHDGVHGNSKREQPKTKSLATKIRPEILRFADIMEVVMSKNDSEKGDSWKRLPHDELQAMLLKEVEESNVDNAKIKEWIDIANFCMMIYNNTIDGISEKHILESHESDKISGLSVTPKPSKKKGEAKG